jgi:membrane associated rhomboid family serine protease
MVPQDAPWRALYERPVTYGFVALCWIAYAATLWLGGVGRSAGGAMGLLAPAGDALQAAGWLEPNLVVRHGQWERVAASLALHGGLLHILFNSSVLLQLGRLLETLVGSRRTLFVLLFSGFCGSAATIVWSLATGKPQHVVGASGAGCGLGAALWAMWLGAKDGVLAEHRKQLFAWLVVCLLMGLIPGISLLGHLGGALGGAFAGVLLRKRGGIRLKGDGWTRAFDASALALTVLFAVGVAVAAARAPDRRKTLAAVEPLIHGVETVETWIDAPPEADDVRALFAALDAVKPSRALAPVRAALREIVERVAETPGHSLPEAERAAVKARLAEANETLMTEALATGRYRLRAP